jgi:predicted nucleic acid binding AN1-type Zn finger protein
MMSRKNRVVRRTLRFSENGSSSPLTQDAKVDMNTVCCLPSYPSQLG